jgi:hypothetical protein
MLHQSLNRWNLRHGFVVQVEQVLVGLRGLSPGGPIPHAANLPLLPNAVLPKPQLPCTSRL